MHGDTFREFVHCFITGSVLNPNVQSHEYDRKKGVGGICMLI